MSSFGLNEGQRFRFKRCHLLASLSKASLFFLLARYSVNRVLFQPCRYILVYRFTVSRRPVLSRASWPPKSAEAGPGALSYFRESPVTFSCRRIVNRVPPSASKYLPVTLYFLTPPARNSPPPFCFFPLGAPQLSRA